MRQQWRLRRNDPHVAGGCAVQRLHAVAGMQTPRDDQAIGRGVLKSSAVGCLGGLSARRPHVEPDRSRSMLLQLKLL